MSGGAKRVIVILSGIGLVSAWAGESLARRRAQHNVEQALRAQRRLELELGGLRTEREQLAGSLSSEQQRTKQLSARLSAKDEELQDVVSRLAQEEYIIQELQGRLLAMQNQLDVLQGELAVSFQERASGQAQAPNGLVQLEKVVVTRPEASHNSLQGHVISVHPEWQFVVVDLGWDAVTIGDIVSIYRNNELLGKARIERVQEQASTATLLPEWTKAEIQVNDLVRAL